MWDNAQHAADLFSKKIKGFTYTRTANPTTAAFEKRIAALEGAERAVATLISENIKERAGLFK